MEKARTLSRGNNLATVFLFSLDRRWYSKLVLSLKNDYMKQQQKTLKSLTDMCRLMVDFDPTRATVVSWGRNEGMNVGNMVAEPGTEGGQGSWRRQHYS